MNATTKDFILMDHTAITSVPIQSPTTVFISLENPVALPKRALRSHSGVIALKAS